MAPQVDWLGSLDAEAVVELPLNLFPFTSRVCIISSKINTYPVLIVCAVLNRDNLQACWCPGSSGMLAPTTVSGP